MNKELFLKFYEDFLDKITRRQLLEFQLLTNNKDRIRFIYEWSLSDPISLRRTPKDFSLAKTLKQQGNLFYKQKEFDLAISVYIKALKYCPRVQFDERRFFSIIAANLSAVYIEKEDYDRAFLQVNYVLTMKDYPKELKYKILMRKGKCIKYLKQSKNEVLHCYNQALMYLDKTDMCREKKQELTQSINGIIKSVKREKFESPRCDTPDMILSKYFPVFLSNEKYPALSRKVTVAADETQGRFIKAENTIVPGEIVAVEDPYASVLYKHTLNTHCYHCKKRCSIIVPCEYCITIVYCSTICHDDAISYHKFECRLLETIYDNDVYSSGLLALHGITIKDVSYFLSEQYDVEFESMENYNSESYAAIYNLCDHTNKTDYKKMLEYTLVSVTFLRLLKQTSYFDYITDANVLTDTECHIGSIILKNMSVFRCNSHAIYEAKHCSRNPFINHLSEPDIDDKPVGPGIFATLSLFNHSCDPSVLRCSFGHNTVLRAIKPIKKGDMVFDNYGPIYSLIEINGRRKFLAEGYHFNCRCEACAHKYPLYNDINSHASDVVCMCCRLNFMLPNCVEMLQLCQKRCEQKNISREQRKQLEEGATYTLRGLEMYYEYKYEEALIQLSKSLTVCYANLSSPHVAIVDIQQKFFQCMTMIKSTNY